MTISIIAPSLILLDMDGVIADTAPGHKRAWNAYMARHGRRFTDEEFLAIFGTGNKELCRILFPDTELSPDAIKRIGDEKEALFREMSRGLLRPYPGFHEFLDACERDGIPVAVGSSACRANVDFVLEDMGIADRFAATVSADDVRHAKPAPDIFLKAAGIVGVEPKDCLVVEDSLMGIEAAHAAGMKVVGMATTHHRDELEAADLVVEDFRDLLDPAPEASRV